MSQANREPTPVLMIAFSYYESDTRVIREAEAAVEAGFDVDFLSLRRPDSPTREDIRGVHVIRLDQSKYRGGGKLRYILSYLEFFLRCMAVTTVRFVRRRYPVIHVNNMPDFLVFAALVPWIFGSKVILDIHDPMPNTFASKFRTGERGLFFKLLLWQEQLSARFSHQVLTVHHPVREAVLRKHGLPDVEIVANFPDEAIFPPRAHFDATPEQLWLAFHGTILERAGLRVAIEAMARVRHRSRIRLLIVGEGDFSEGVRSLIRDLHIEDAVEFDNRAYPAHVIAQRIARCQAGLVPLEISSITEHALPLKLMEYISLGLPVVSVRNSAISHYLTEDDCLFFDWDSPTSLAAVLDRLIDEPETLLRYRQRSLDIRAKFTWTHEKRKYVEILLRLVGQPAGNYAAGSV